jgi:hypothetical protein
MLPPMSTNPTPMSAPAYERLAGRMAIVAGLGGIVYSVAFLGGVVAGYAAELGIAVSSTALLIGGVLSVGVMVAIYRRLLDSAPALALLGLALVAIGSAGSIVHVGYDLANAIQPPTADVLLVVVYLGRLIILTPTNPVVAVSAAAAGLVVNPAFYIWLGLELRRR